MNYLPTLKSRISSSYLSVSEESFAHHEVRSSLHLNIMKLMFHTQKGNFLPLIGILIIALMFSGTIYFFQKNKEKLSDIRVQDVKEIVITDQKNALSSLNSDNLPILTGPSSWKTYINSKYSYKIKYPPDKSFEELKVSDYEYTDFLHGCFKVFVVPPKFNDKQLQVKTNVLWTKLAELENAVVESISSYLVDEWELGNEINFKEISSYRKLPKRTISGTQWQSFEVTNNWENYGTHNVYFTNRNNKIYLVDMLSYGPCYADEPIKMLSTFTFTK